ncbi:MAG: acyl-CoA synthetase [Actinomycetota bacterium]
MSVAGDERLYPGAIGERDPDRPAVAMGATGEVMTYAELDTYANRLARLLRARGLERGDQIALCVENRLEFLPLIWGCHYAGLYYTPISTRLTGDEIAYIVDDCGAKAYIGSTYKATESVESAAVTPKVMHRFAVGGPVPGHEDLDALLRDQPSAPLADRREAVEMLYSSGTTGRPKGVKPPLPDAPLGEPGRFVHMARRVFGVTDGSRYLSPAPLYHAAPLRFCMAALRVGATVVVMERFDAEQMLSMIERHRISTTQLVPTMFVRMLKLPDDVRARYDVSSLTHATHAAAPCPVEVKHRMLDWWGPIIHEFYAGTEGAGICYISPTDWLERPGSVGQAIGATIHVVDENGAELPPGEEGQIYSDSSSDFEYHNDPAKTAETRHPAGWRTLGDIGRVDADGFLFLTDRKAFTINSGGVNVYPQEAENALVLHPAVADVAVFGVPNEDFGEEVKAVVQLETPVDSAAELAALEVELISHCRSQLADIKCPRSIDFRSELPREPTGKLLKKKLRDEYWPARA